jgi:hypothetical protein
MKVALAHVPALLASIFAVAAPAQQPASTLAPDETIKLYCAAWSEPDAQRRQQMLDQVWAASGTYTDPTAHVEGRTALNAHIANFLKRTPGGRIAATSHVDIHHGNLRFTWKLVGVDGKTLSEGIDFGVLDSEGKIQMIVGFFGPTEPL